MTSKEEAKDLVGKFYDVIAIDAIKSAKQCALIATERILIVLERLPKSEYPIKWEKLHFKQVKEEINKL